MIKVDKIYLFTIAHTFFALVTAHYVSLNEAFEYPHKFPEYHYEFYMGVHFAFWWFTMVNLVLANVRKSTVTNLETDDLCKTCRKQRPQRAHHCSACKECVLRMDHHCVWINNCVGLNNHKNFFYYVFFTCLAGFYHTYLVVMFTLYSESSFSILLLVAYYYHSIVVGVFSYFCFTLLFLQVNLILRNNTNIEYFQEMGVSMAFMKFRFYPIVRFT